MPAEVAVCRCGHAADAHSHLRKGTDCALCGRGACPRFSPLAAEQVSLLSRIRSRFARRAVTEPVLLTHPRLRIRRSTSPNDPGDDKQAKEA